MSHLLTTEQAAEYLNVTRRWLELDRFNQGKVPYIRMTRRTIRYSKSELDKYLKVMTVSVGGKTK